MVVPEEVQEAVDEWPAPLVLHDLRADDDVAELPRHAVGQLVPAVDREGEDVGRLVDAEVLTLQGTDLVLVDERDAEVAAVDPLRRAPVSSSTEVLVSSIDDATITSRI